MRKALSTTPDLIVMVWTALDGLEKGRTYIAVMAVGVAAALAVGALVEVRHEVVIVATKVRYRLRRHAAMMQHSQKIRYR